MSKVRLGDLVSVVNEREDHPAESKYDRFVGLEHYDSGSVKINRWGSTELLVSAMKVFHKGDILVARRNVYLKRASYVDFDGLTSGDSIILRVKDPSNLRLIPFVLNTDEFWDYADQHADGTMSKRLAPAILLDYEFNMPENKEKLSKLLWGIERTKDAYKAVIAKTDELVKSQFVEMFDAVEGAEYIPLEKCCLSVSGGNTPSMKHEEYYGGDVPFIKSGDVKDAYVSSGALWLTQEALDKTMAKLVPAGTVIVVIRSGILKHDLPVAIASNPVVINQDLKAFQPKPNFTSQYLAWAIRVKENELLSMTRAMTVDNIESQELYNIPVMVAPIGLQREFSDFVEQCDKSKLEAKHTLDSLNAMQKSLMRQHQGGE